MASINSKSIVKINVLEFNAKYASKKEVSKHIFT